MAKAGERYTIRQKILKVFGASFHVFDAEGNVVGFAKQKAFRLREDIRLYTDESCSEELLIMRTQQVIDFGATYDVTLPDGSVVASYRRKGMQSMLRDTWVVFDPAGGSDAPAATLREDSMGAALARRFVPYAAIVMPQRFRLEAADGRSIATLRAHFNPLVYRLGITVHEEDGTLDDLAILAAGVLVAAIEGRQSE